MNHGIVIIGSGFAARQLVKNIRKLDANVPVTLIAADSIDEYNKPDLSHVISQSQRADDLTRQTAGEFAEQFNLRLFPWIWVTDIDAAAHVVKAGQQSWQYDKLVQRAGAETHRGVRVDSYLQTTQPDIFALGDCAEINGDVLPFLQPIQLSAMYLAKNLLGARVPLKLPAMLVKVKTPELPLQLAGETGRRDLRWQIETSAAGMVAQGFDEGDQLCAFAISEDRMKEAFTLLKQLPPASHSPAPGS